MTKDPLALDGIWAQHAQQIQLALILHYLENAKISEKVAERALAKELARISTMHAGELFHTLEAT